MQRESRSNRNALYHGAPVEHIGNAGMPYMDVIADFEKDHVEIIRQDLKYWETELIGLSEEDIAFGYYELMHRMISAEPRRVHFSREFSCPTEHRNGLNWLVSKLRIGEPTFPHLSRKINKLKAHDKHLSDWGIQHLHLGTSYLPNIDRSLFA